MPAAKADWFTEGSKVVRQGRFRHSSGRLRHDGDNPLSRDSGQSCSSIVIIIQLKYAIFQQLSLTNLQQKYIIWKYYNFHMNCWCLLPLFDGLLSLALVCWWWARDCPRELFVRFLRAWDSWQKIKQSWRFSQKNSSQPENINIFGCFPSAQIFMIKNLPSSSLSTLCGYDKDFLKTKKQIIKYIQTWLQASHFEWKTNICIKIAESIFIFALDILICFMS